MVFSVFIIFIDHVLFVNVIDFTPHVLIVVSAFSSNLQILDILDLISYEVFGIVNSSIKVEK